MYPDSWLPNEGTGRGTHLRLYRFHRTAQWGQPETGLTLAEPSPIMNPQRLRTIVFFLAGLALAAQFAIQQLAEGVEPSGIILLAAAAILIGLAIMRVRAPTPTDREGLGIVEWALLVLLAVLLVITAGLGVLFIG